MNALFETSTAELMKGAELAAAAKHKRDGLATVSLFNACLDSLAGGPAIEERLAAYTPKPKMRKQQDAGGVLFADMQAAPPAPRAQKATPQGLLF